MANQEDAFVKSMRLAAYNNPELFTLRNGDFYFLDWKLTAWMAISLSDLLHAMFDMRREAATARQEVAA